MTARIQFDQGACTGCKVCIAACCDAHNLPVGQQLRWVDIHEEGEWVRENGLAVMKGVRAWADCHACQHCDEPDCVPECRFGAIAKDDNGVVFIDADKCTGCGKCGKACPHSAIITVARESGSKQKVSKKCDMCRNIPEGPQCVAACVMRCLTIEK